MTNRDIQWQEISAEVYWKEREARSSHGTNNNKEDLDCTFQLSQLSEMCEFGYLWNNFMAPSGIDNKNNVLKLKFEIKYLNFSAWEVRLVQLWLVYCLICSNLVPVFFNWISNLGFFSFIKNLVYKNSLVWISLLENTLSSATQRY